MHRLVNFNNEEQLVTAFSQQIADLLKAAILRKGRATFAVSGGSTPKRLFEVLSAMPLAWEKVDIMLVDERWVDGEHSDSNTRLVKRMLLTQEAKKAHWVDIKTQDASPVDAVAQLNQTLSQYLPADVLILGMGNDGHTASLFPCATETAQAMDSANVNLVAAVTPTTAPHHRISLTLANILSASSVFLHLRGDDKRETLNKALSGQDESEMPIRAVLNSSAVDSQVYWCPNA